MNALTCSILSLRSLASVAGVFAIVFISPAVAQEWPTRPLTMVAPFAAGGSTDAIARISNSKPNARELLWGVRDKLSAHRQVENIKFLAKNSASQPAPKELLQEVAANYKAALLALGD